MFPFITLFLSSLSVVELIGVFQGQLSTLSWIISYYNVYITHSCMAYIIFLLLCTVYHYKNYHRVKMVNSVVEASIPTILLFCVIRKDVDYLYKWQTFWPRGLHQSQISHANNNITIITIFIGSAST